MPTDELLAPLLTPWYRRVDQRLALILAVSFGGHLTLALVAGQADPPLDPFAAAFLPPRPTPAQAEFELVTITPADPPVVARPAPGAAVPRTSALTAPATVARRTTTTPGQPARPLDVAALAADLGGGDAALPSARPRAPGADLSAQLAQARAQGLQVRLGNGEAPRDDAPLIGEATAPAWNVASQREVGVRATHKTESDGAARVSLGRPLSIGPHAGTEFDPNPTIAARYMAALRRCYQRALAADPRLTGRVDLRFTIDPDGAVSQAEARASNELMAEVAACVEDLAADWRFGYRGDAPVRFSLRLVFVQGG